MGWFNAQNPGIGGLDELTTAEETAVQTMASLGTALQVLRTNAGVTGVEWATVSGTGDVVKVGTPVDNQVGVWTGDGSIEGDTALTFDTTTNTLTTGILNVTGLTASEMVLTDSSKNLVSAAVATYPSLTELTYLKGVTSAIQTQINAKQASDTQLTSLASLAYAGNSLKVVRVNVGETDFELATAGVGDVTKVGTPANNQIGVWTGDGTIEGDTDLTWSPGFAITIDDTENVVGLTVTQNDVTNDPNAVNIVMGAGTGSALNITTTNTVFPGTKISLYNTAAIDGESIGSIHFEANDDGAARTEFASIGSEVLDNTEGTEDGHLYIRTMLAGTATTRMTVGNGINGIKVGASTATGIISSGGDQDLTIQTGNATTGTITIADGAAGQITIAPATTGVVQILSSDAGTTGAVLELYQDSASPLGGDDVGTINFYGEDSASNKQLYAQIRGEISSPTSTTEGGNITFRTVASGTLADRMECNSLGAVPSTNDGYALGSTTQQWSDLFLAEGGVINWDNGDATLTQVGDVVTLAGADLKVSSPGTASTSVATIDATQTLTNKRVTKRTGTTTSHATPTINTDNVDFYSITAQAEAITSMTTNLSGTPTEAQTLWIAITGTAARAITWGASFEASTVALPTTTVTTNRLDVGFIWNTVTNKWRCIASA